MAGSAGQMWQAMGERRAAEQAMHEWESSEPVRKDVRNCQLLPETAACRDIFFAANSLQGYFLWVFITTNVTNSTNPESGAQPNI